MITQEVSEDFDVSRSKLLDLLLGKGQLRVKLFDQKLTITTFSDQRIICATDIVETYSVNVSGKSNRRSVRTVSGSGTVSRYKGNSSYKCSLVLHVEEII
jgi:hypothetical protein